MHGAHLSGLLSMAHLTLHSSTSDSGNLDLLGPGNFEELKKRLATARKERTHAALSKIDPHIADMTIGLDEKPPSGKHGKSAAATTIQRVVRGCLHRKIFENKLFEQFEKDEAERQRLQKLQIREGEALLRETSAMKQAQDIKLTIRNKRAIYNHKAHLIQRQFRKWKMNQKRNLASWTPREPT